MYFSNFIGVLGRRHFALSGCVYMPRNIKKIKQRPVTFVVFGATGDLAQKKLFPAILKLYQKKMLSEKFSVVAFSRRPWQDNDFRNFIRNVFKNGRKKNIENFLEKISYAEGDFKNVESYKKVARLVLEIDERNKICADRLLYLAAPPVNYEDILKNIDKAGLSIPCVDSGWNRILIEKPFGTDAKTAERLEKMLSRLFIEKQIFRIDHYLAKETLQNILAFRFSNAIFEPVWNRKFVESVYIRFYEKGGIAGRGLFYDGLGALRDVGQNHLLQMLSLVAMDNPGILSGEKVREKRAKVLRSLSLAERVHFRRGQYLGYKNEKGVSCDSQTETYFFAAAEIKNKRWDGVPFYLESGKNLDRNEVTITVNFKPKAFCLPKPFCYEYRNRIVFRIQPNEGIETLFWAKRPGFESVLAPEIFSFSYQQGFSGKSPGAYERVLYDAIRGDQTLFGSTSEISASWKFIFNLLKKIKKVKLEFYKSGASFQKTAN